MKNGKKTVRRNQIHLNFFEKACELLKFPKDSFLRDSLRQSVANRRLRTQNTIRSRRLLRSWINSQAFLDDSNN